MKVFLLIMMMSIFLLCSGIVNRESMRTVTIPGTDLSVTMPEQAPDFHLFPLHILGMQRFSNGNAMMFLEAMNKDHTVGVILVMAGVGDKVGVLCMQVSYCQESFDKFDINKKHPTDCYEDSVFMKTGRVTNILQKVDKLTEFDEFKKYLDPGRDT